jgi:hypothetical protein
MYWYVLVCTVTYHYMIFGTDFLMILKGTSVDILVIYEYILCVPDDFAGLLGPACRRFMHCNKHSTKSH